MRAPDEIIHEIRDEALSHIGYIVVRRVGQRPIEESDEVVVHAELHLFADGAGDLPEEIRFQNRLYLFSSYMHSWWGIESNYKGKKTRMCAYRAYAKTWRAAMEEAEAHALSSAKMLLDALAARRQALIDAEKIEPAGKKKRSK